MPQPGPAQGIKWEGRGGQAGGGLGPPSPGEGWKVFWRAGKVPQNCGVRVAVAFSIFFKTMTDKTHKLLRRKATGKKKSWFPGPRPGRREGGSGPPGGVEPPSSLPLSKTTLTKFLGPATEGPQPFKKKPQNHHFRILFINLSFFEKVQGGGPS